MTKQRRKAIKQGIINPATQKNCKTGNHIDFLKFVPKVSDKDDEKSKLILAVSYEESIPKLDTRFCKRQVKSTTQIVSNTKLMHKNTKDSYLAEVLVDE